MGFRTLAGGRAVPVLTPVELTVVIPTFNERDNISLLISRLETALDGPSLGGNFRR